jgi:hypothetical protein
LTVFISTIFVFTIFALTIFGNFGIAGNSWRTGVSS